MLSLFGLGILLWITALFVGIISWIFALSVKQIKRVLQARSALLPGVCAIMPSTSTVSADGSKPAKCALLIIASGSSRSMATKIDGTSRTAGWASFKPALGSKRTCRQMSLMT